MAIAVVLSGCTQRPAMSFAMKIDPSFDTSEAEIVADAARDWEAHVAGLAIDVMIGHCTDQDACIQVQPGRLEHTGNEFGATGRDNYLDSNDSTIGIAAPPRYQRITALHEIGHALGMHHVSVPSVMCVVGQHDCATDEINAVDVAQFWEVRQ